MDEGQSKDERAQFLLTTLDRVEDVLEGLSASAKVLVTLRVAASWSIANDVTPDAFAAAAKEIFIQTYSDIMAYGEQLAAAETAKASDAPADAPTEAP